MRKRKVKINRNIIKEILHCNRLNRLLNFIEIRSKVITKIVVEKLKNRKEKIVISIDLLLIYSVRSIMVKSDRNI
jgi:hypothetical protein